MALLNEVKQPVSELVRICKVINNLPGVIAIQTDMLRENQVRVQMRFNDLIDLANNTKLDFEARKSDGKPRWALSLELVEGSKFFALADQEEWEDYCKANDLCPKCGSEKTEYTEYEGDEQIQMKECPNNCIDSELA